MLEAIALCEQISGSELDWSTRRAAASATTAGGSATCGRSRPRLPGLAPGLWRSGDPARDPTTRTPRSGHRPEAGVSGWVARRAGTVRTVGRRPRRSAGCSGRSAATGAAARARAGRPTPGRSAGATRGLGTEPRVEVEGGADADEQGCGGAAAASAHPELLGRDAEADPDDGGAGARR